MLFRFTKYWVALGLLAALWGLSKARETDARAWLRPVGAAPGPVRIIQFYASTGLVAAGEKALLCYGVENARSIRISPHLGGIYPAFSRCLEIVPEHTTHYTLLAEGFDGRVTSRSFTVAVQIDPAPPENLNYADRFRRVDIRQAGL
jgi:hypothetical protein